MTGFDVVETHHFRQCFQTRCLNYGGFIPAEVTHCPLCGERAPYVGEAGKVKYVQVNATREEDWTHGMGYEKAEKDDIGL